MTGWPLRLEGVGWDAMTASGRTNLSQQDALYRGVLDAMAEGLVVHDAQGRITFCNRAAEGILGLEAPALVGRSARDPIWDPVDIDGAPFSLDRLPSVVAIREHVAVGPEIIGVRTGDGRRIWLKITSTPIEGVDGGKALTTFTDISELIETQSSLRAALAELEQAHNAEQALSGRLTRYLGRQLDQSLATLAVSEQRFRLAMELGMSVAFILDNELRYSWIHSCQVGYDDAAVIGKRCRDLFAPESADLLHSIYRQVLETGVAARQDICIRSLAMSKPQHFDFIVKPLRNLQGASGELICVAIDITARKETEAALRAATASAEQAYASKSRFLAAASHDLSQPMQALQMYCAILADRMPNPGQQAKQCANKLSNHLKALLSLSRLDGGSVLVRPAPVRLGEMLEQVVASYRPMAESKGLRLKVVASAVEIETDPILFERMLGNLVSNAVRYTERGGVLIGVRRRDGRWRVEVWDSGIGIPTEQIPLIFEELYQLHNPTRTPEKGVGLGLAIVDRTAQLLGMRVWARSVVGKGSVFVVELAGTPA